MSRPRVALIVAAGDNGVIGRDGTLPWHLSSDLRFFRRMTLSKPVIMGRKTFESIGRPLDARTNIVVTRDRDYSAPGVHCVHDIDTALRLGETLATAADVDEIMVIGGAEIYRAVLDRADRIYLTRVHASPEGDAYLPLLEPSQWHEVSREFHPAGPDDDHDFTIEVLDRRWHGNC